MLVPCCGRVDGRWILEVEFEWEKRIRNMKTIVIKAVGNEARVVDEVALTLAQSGVVCMPCGGTYRLLSDLRCEEAVMKLLQSKRRTQRTHTLVFVSDKVMLREVVSDVEPVAERLVHKVWPGPVTILFEASPTLPRKVVKHLLSGRSKIGVRVPEDPFVMQVIEAFGGPVLVSSANREKKHGARSPAQVRKTFFGRVNLFLDAGDLAVQPASTIVDFHQGEPVITRVGAISGDQIQTLCA
jgi:L-threonylcarbamoyladenylate synthase